MKHRKDGPAWLRAREIVTSTEPLSEERADQFRRLGAEFVDCSYIRRRCEECLEAGIRALETVTIAASEARDPGSDMWNILRGASAADPRQLAEEILGLDDVVASVPIHQLERALFEPNLSAEKDVARRHRDFAILHHLISVVLALAYSKSDCSVEYFLLDRSISHHKAALMVMPDASFRSFGDDLVILKREVQQLQTLFQHVELEECPMAGQVLCGVCFDLNRIIGYHESEHAVFRFFAEDLSRNANRRCRSCSVFLEAMASMHAVLGLAWDDIVLFLCINVSVARWWTGKVEDSLVDDFIFKSEMMGGRDQPAAVSVQGYDSTGKLFSRRFELYMLKDQYRPWPVIGIGRHVNSEVDSPETWKMVEDWLTTCRLTHKTCGEEGGDLLPKRLLDVGSDNADPKLHVTTPGERGRYAALSHCWGQVIPLRMTRDTLEKLQRGIKLAEFPATFRDAITACRRLQLRYLWLDSLCIIQDDQKDWEEEANKMGTVYRNAFITIAAAAAHDSTEGCFQQRPWSIRADIVTVAPRNDGDSVEKVEIFARPWFTQNSWTRNIGDGPEVLGQHPLETRAWTLQEHLLSRRILRFAANELVWQCLDYSTCECLGRSTSHKYPPDLVCLEAIRKAHGSSSHLKHESPDSQWEEAVSKYSGRSITYESDLLPAISGFASALSSATGLTYIAGMWKEWLPWQVCWRVDERGAHRHKEYYAPSWSWASLVGALRPARISFARGLLSTDILDVNFSLATRNRFGKLAHATLTLYGIVLDVSVVRKQKQMALAGKQASTGVVSGTSQAEDSGDAKSRTKPFPTILISAPSLADHDEPEVPTSDFCGLGGPTANTAGDESTSSSYEQVNEPCMGDTNDGGNYDPLLADEELVGEDPDQDAELGRTTASFDSSRESGYYGASSSDEGDTQGETKENVKFRLKFPDSLLHVLGPDQVVRTEAYLDIVDSDGRPSELDLAQPVQLLVTGTDLTPWGGFAALLGVLIVAAAGGPGTGTPQHPTYARVGMARIQLKGSLREPGLMRFDENAIACKAAARLVREGFKKTINIV